MANNIDSGGLVVNSTLDIATNLTNGFQSAYGVQINTNPNSPDGEMINITAQAMEDNLQLLVQVYNSFSPDSAFGTVLDQRVAINGIQRHQGSYTVAFISVVVSTALTLTGSDALAANQSATVFTVADTAGNKYQLQTTTVFSGAGTQSLAFVCTTLGQIQTAANTITTVVTTVPGVTSVNNPDVSNDVEGTPEETDPQLKIRRVNSFFLQAVGPADSIRAALLNVSGCVDAYVAENNTASLAAGVPANGIWVIVNGGGDLDVATAIYTKKNPGSAMAGAQSFAVVRQQGNTTTIKWDTAATETLYLQATLHPRTPNVTFDTTADGIALAAALIYKLGQSPNSGDIAIAMQAIEPTAVVIDAKVSSDGITYQQIVSPSDFKHFFVVTAARITLTNG